MTDSTLVQTILVAAIVLPSRQAFSHTFLSFIAIRIFTIPSMNLYQHLTQDYFSGGQPTPFTCQFIECLELTILISRHPLLVFKE